MAGSSNRAQHWGTCLVVVSRPPTNDPLPQESWEQRPAGSRYAGFPARCRLPGVSESWPPSLPPPPPPAHLCQPPASISAFKPALASALAPPQLNWTSSCLPAFPAPRGQRGCSRLSEAAEELLGSAAAKPALPAVGCRQAWAATRYLPPPRVAHFADHLRCRANSVLNPIVSLPSSPRSLA